MEKKNIVKFAIEIINDSIRKNGANEEVQKKLNDFKYYLETQGYSNNIFDKLFKEMGQIVTIVFDVNEHSPLSPGELIEITDDAIEKYIIKSDFDRMFDAFEEESNSEIDVRLKSAFKPVINSKEFYNSTQETSFDYGIRETGGCDSDIRTTPSCGEIRETGGCDSDIRTTPSCGETREKSGCESDVRVTPSCGGRTRRGC